VHIYILFTHDNCPCFLVIIKINISHKFIFVTPIRRYSLPYAPCFFNLSRVDVQKKDIVMVICFSAKNFFYLAFRVSFLNV
jgi:hypothetical protein